MRVLVCDDDASVRAFLAAVFEVDGWLVDAVDSGEACLEALAAPPLPDVLVVDQVMPGLQGTEVAEQLRKNGFRQPIILCSAHLDAARKDDISRLDLLTVNKIDAGAVVRVAQAAVQEAERAKPAAGRRRQQWPD